MQRSPLAPKDGRRPATRTLAVAVLAVVALLLVVLLALRTPPAGALPPGGTDAFSVTGLVAVSSSLGAETFPVSGVATIKRGEPFLDGLVEVVDIEIVSMNLSGESVTGPVTIVQRPAVTSTGQMRSLQPSGDFPASAFFDVFIDVSVPASPSFTNPIVLHNDQPLHLVPTSGGVEVPISAWPPVGVTFYTEPNPPAGAGAGPQTFPIGEPHCTNGLQLLPSLPAKVCIDSLSIVIQADATPTPPPPKLPEPGDTDQDGCSDVTENGPSAELGGERNYADYWDFYDVWTSRIDNPQAWQRNKVITIFDILAVAARFGTGPLLSPEAALAAALLPPIDATSYHPAYDRGPQTGANSWDRAPPDGVIGITDDILVVAGQFGHTCA